MSFTHVRGRAVNAIFERLGEAATWTDVPGFVQIRFREQDDIAPGDDPGLVLTTHFIRVRRSEVAEPQPGDVVAPQESGGTYVVTGSPRIDRKGVWLCEVLAQ